MTDDELISAAHHGRVVHVPGCGYLVDGEVAADEDMVRFRELAEEGLLERDRGAVSPSVQAPLVPTRRGLDRIGVAR